MFLLQCCYSPTSGSWPLDSSCLVYNLEILKACRHHFAHIGGSLLEDSLCFLSSEVSHLCPGPFVQIQLVVALRTGNNGLLDCHLVAGETGQFKVVCTCAVPYMSVVKHM